MAVHYLSVSWKDYHEQTQHLASAILGNKLPIDEIVAISRGGLTLGHLLSDMLRIPIWTISIQSYTDIQQQGEVKITGKLNTSIRDKHILLVDDVSDTGTTIKRAISYLKRFKPKKITTLTLYYKPHSIYRPDFFAKQTSDWILFPYEPIESIVLISRQLEKKGMSKAQIQTFLKRRKFTDKQIQFARKHHLATDAV